MSMLVNDNIKKTKEKSIFVRPLTILVSKYSNYFFCRCSKFPINKNKNVMQEIKNERKNGYRQTKIKT